MTTTAPSGAGHTVTWRGRDYQALDVTDELCARIMAGVTSMDTAVGILITLGLTADRDLLVHAMGARYMRYGIADGTIRPEDVAPGVRADQRAGVVAALADQYAHEYAAAVAALATPRDLP